ncbi:MAG: SDR family NAD(P)-dependent oxidoreductase [Myxococcota bacterium]
MLRDRVALVTGASSGIGAAIAIRLAEAGATVVGAARRVDRVAALSKDHSGIHARSVDLRDEASIAALFLSIREEFGGVDVLVNNAGLGHHAPLVSGDSERWREMLEVNVLALAICTREAISDMRRRGDRGHVVHVSSMAGHRVPGGSGVYSATKYAVRALTEGLRQELRAAESHIRVSAVSPGFVETEFAEHYHQSAERARETYRRYPVLQAEDVAETVFHVLSAPSHVQIHDVLMRPTEQPG